MVLWTRAVVASKLVAVPRCSPHKVAFVPDTGPRSDSLN